MPTFGSLFAGIGGIDLGLERAGWTGRWQVEYEPFCQRVLAAHWPDVTRYGDIHDVDWSSVEPVDLVAGGFPCQPISSAGNQKAQADERWLWPEFLRCVRALRPRYVLVENVTNLLAVNDGSAFGDVIGGLAASGYDAEWDCLPASSVGALHERDRVWIVAYPAGVRRAAVSAIGRGVCEEQDGGWDAESARRGRAPLANAEREGLQGISGSGTARERWSPGLASGSREAMADTRSGRSQGSRQPIFARHPAADSSGQADEPLDGRLGHVWATEPDVGRVAHGVPARVDRLRSLGNAVVPQVVEFIGRRIIEAEGLT